MRDIIKKELDRAIYLTVEIVLMGIADVAPSGELQDFNTVKNIITIAASAATTVTVNSLQEREGMTLSEATEALQYVESRVNKRFAARVDEVMHNSKLRAATPAGEA